MQARPSSAEWPPAEGADLSDSANWPSDPGYAGQWNLWSFMPSENDSRVTDYERSIGSGLHADRAWQLTTGDRRVVIAVVDSGIRWRERDLVNKYIINRGELPVPEAACSAAPGTDPYDANGDGFKVFSDGIVDVAIAGVISLPTLVRGDGTLIGILANGSYGELTNSDDVPSFVSIANGSAGDLDNDGIVDVVWGGAGLGFAEAFASSGSRVDIDHHVGAWNSKTRPYLPGFPRRAGDHQFFMNPAIADVDDDGRPEVISGSGGYYLRAWNSDGEEPSTWPKFTGGWIIASPAVGDLDGDGILEVAVATREGFLYVWNTEGKSDGRIDWASFHHDDRNTGNLEMPIGFGVGARPGGDDGGCGCRGTSSNSSSISLLLLAFVVVVGRRGRRRR